MACTRKRLAFYPFLSILSYFKAIVTTRRLETLREKNRSGQRVEKEREGEHIELVDDVAFKE